MKLGRFHSFNESANPDVLKLNPNAIYSLYPGIDGALSFLFCGSEEYTLKVSDEKKLCELIPPVGQFMQMTFDEVEENRDGIIALEPTHAEGETLYKWVTRILSVVEWANSSSVWKWHTFESDNNEPQPLGSTSYRSSSEFIYTFQASNGIFSLEILRDKRTFKLTCPNMEYAIIGTLDDLSSNQAYYKSLAPHDVVYNWIKFSFVSEYMKEKFKSDSL
jgi:hypothetical protein